MGAVEPELAALGRTIRQARERRTLSTEDLARAAGVPRKRVEALEDGRWDPRLDVLWALADALDVELAYLTSGAMTVLRRAASGGETAPKR